MWRDAALSNDIISLWVSIKQRDRGTAPAVNVEDKMNQKKEVFYGKKGLPEWIVEQLTMGTMDGFLPASFIETENGLEGIFSADGYRPLSHLHNLSTEELFQMLCQLISQMENNESHYLYPERYLMNLETIYYDPLKNRVKLIFLPNEEELSGQEQLLRLITDCKRMISEEGEGYLDSLAEEMRTDSMNYRSAIRRCELLQQEIYVCDIP